MVVWPNIEILHNSKVIKGNLKPHSVAFSPPSAPLFPSLSQRVLERALAVRFCSVRPFTLACFSLLSNNYDPPFSNIWALNLASLSSFSSSLRLVCQVRCFAPDSRCCL